MHIHTNLRTSLLLPCGLLALLALGLASPGCGGSSSEQSLTKREFIAQADHICAGAPSDVVAAAADYEQKHPGAEETNVITTVALPILEKEVRQIKALGLPDEGAVEVGAYVRAFESGIRDIKKDPLDALVAETNPFLKARAVADAYGLKACNSYP